LDWGTVPAWVGAILTSGSLALGFYVLLRDRRKEERTEASLVVCWRVWSDEEFVTHIHNASQRAVVDVTVLVRVPARSQVKDPHWEAVGGPAVLRAGTEEIVRSPRRIAGEKWVPAFVTFQDADGIFWVRDLPTGDLKRLKTTRALRGSSVDEYVRSQRPSRALWKRVVSMGRTERAE